MWDTLSQQEMGAQVQHEGDHLAGDAEHTCRKDRAGKWIGIFSSWNAANLVMPWAEAGHCILPLAASFISSACCFTDCAGQLYQPTPPHQVFGFPTCSCWCLLTGKQQDVLRFGLSELLPHANKPSLDSLVGILSLCMCSWVGGSQVWEEGAWSCSKQTPGAHVLVLKWQMTQKGCSVTQEDGNIGTELFYRKRKWYNTDNNRVNDKLLGIAIVISSRHGNEELLSTYECGHAIYCQSLWSEMYNVQNQERS